MTNDICGCCKGIQRLTPLKTANRPGLSALAYRVGTHAAFLETMKARLSSLYLDLPRDEFDEHGQQLTDRVYPLRGLTTRASDDPAIALLDSWAVVGTVLTFYQEHIANEGYLRTATERRSILELARLVGYALRPGVSASVFLAYTIDDNAKEPVEVPLGAKSQSVPGPGELPQTFETSEALEARAAWNVLKPRMTKPQTRVSIQKGSQVLPGPRVYLKGISPNLKPNDPLLIDFGDGSTRQLFRVLEVKSNAALDRTLVTLDDWLSAKKLAHMDYKAQVLAIGRRLQDIAERYSQTKDFRVSRTGDIAQQALGHLESLKEADAAKAAEVLTQLTQLLKVAEENPRATRLQQWLGAMVKELSDVAAASAAATESARPTAASMRPQLPSDPLLSILPKLTARPSVPPRNTLYLQRVAERLFPRKAGSAGLQLLSTFRTDMATTFSGALASAKVTPDSRIKVYALRLKASLFGYNAPPRPVRLDNDRKIIITDEWKINNPLNQTEPVAAFRAYPASGFASLTVQFTDQSCGDITSYHWDFGDETKSTVRSPAHKFEEARDYIVTLTVSGPAGTSQAQSVIRVVTESGLMNVPQPSVAAALPLVPTYHQPKVIFLDAEYDISPQSWLVIVKPDGSEPLKIKPEEKSITHQSLVAYGLSGKATRLDLLATEWISNPAMEPFSTVRGTTVYAGSEELELAEEPVTADICKGAAEDDADWIELDGLYSDLKSGRWLVVSGERTDVKDVNNQPVPGVKANELVMLMEVIQDVAREDGRPYYYTLKLDENEQPMTSPLAADRMHTWIRLAKKLEYCYKRDAVTIYGNVVKATHGETRKEVLGSGDGSRALQSSALRQPPLTYIAAPNPSGVESTLKVYVNEVQWPEVDALAGLQPTDRNFITRTNDDGQTTVIFGSGEHGARLPTGLENVRAEYRNGIGKAGNVKAEQISLLMTRPLGVRSVINPQRASGGTNKESRDQARQNAPLAVMALDRLVSVQDYADFTRTFAGIGKATAIRLADGRREIVHVTIAGAEDVPIDPTSDLYLNLLLALRQYGDPYQPFQVDVRELLLLVISANVRILPDYVWDTVATQVRTRLLDTFSFEQRDLGQDVLLSEVISAIQAVPGVAHVDVDLLTAVPEKKAEAGTRRLLTPDEITQVINQLLQERQSEQAKPDVQKKHPQSRIPVGLADHEDGTLRPAQLAILSPNVPDTLILNRIG